MTGMTGEVIAGYDGSADSELALHWAARDARDRGVTLTVCHAWAPEELSLVFEPAMFELARSHGEKIVNRGVEHARPFAGRGGVQPLLVSGPPVRVLCERSGANTMVVVGSRGRGRLAGLLLGSVAWQLAGHGQGRMVIVREAARRPNSAPGPVVAGIDGSPASHAALEFAGEEAALRSLPLLAVCALADAPASLGGARQMEEEFSRQLILWEKDHPAVSVLYHVSQGSPRAALLEAAAEAQMVVVGARGRGGIPGMTLGSVTAALLHHAPCPVGIVRTASTA